MNKLHFIDLFAGMGGMRLAFENSCNKYNITPICVLTSEIKDYGIKVYNKQYNENIVKTDITKFNEKELNKVDFVLAGFPCQPFSYAGKGLGFADTRGTMFFETLRFIKEKQPKGFVLENVEGLVTHDKGRTLKTIISCLEKENYFVTYKILNAYDFGVPQLRKRIYICGSKNKNVVLDDFTIIHNNFSLIKENNNYYDNSDFCKNLLNFYKPNELQGKCIKDKRGGANNIHSWEIDVRGNINSFEKRIMNFIVEERRKKSLANKYSVEWHDGMCVPKSHIEEHFLINIDKELEHLVSLGYLDLRTKDNIYGYWIPTGNLSFTYTRFIDNAKPTNTIVATDIERLGVIDDVGIRHLTTKEMLGLFGYPSTYPLDIVKMKEQYDLIGNTVCVPVVEYCCDKVLQTII